jgi:hypothetical protein
MKTNSIGRTLRLLAFAGVLVVTAFAGTALADPCRADCRKERAACVKECTAMAGCSQFYQTCKQHCIDSSFGEDRHDCLEGCRSDRKECREWVAGCRSECKLEALDCRANCVELGF